jgi:hypothetical protein
MLCDYPAQHPFRREQPYLELRNAHRQATTRVAAVATNANGSGSHNNFNGGGSSVPQSFNHLAATRRAAARTSSMDIKAQFSPAAMLQHLAPFTTSTSPTPSPEFEPLYPHNARLQFAGGDAPYLTARALLRQERLCAEARNQLSATRSAKVAAARSTASHFYAIGDEDDDGGVGGGGVGGSNAARVTPASMQQVLAKQRHAVFGGRTFVASAERPTVRAAHAFV